LSRRDTRVVPLYLSVPPRPGYPTGLSLPHLFITPMKLVA